MQLLIKKAGINTGFFYFKAVFSSAAPDFYRF
jgi:hypothetical protein